MYSDRFNKAWNALIEAYYEGTLAKGICQACAVGNIVTAALGGKIVQDPINKGYFTNNTPEQANYWYDMFFTSAGHQCNYIDQSPNTAAKLKDLTGYSAQEMAKVEFAFETNTKIPNTMYYVKTEQAILEDQFNGLSAVLDVLLSFEETQVKEQPYNRLKAHPKLVAV